MSMVKSDKRVIFKNGFLVLIIILLIGCSSFSPHDNFKAHLYRQIGKRLDEIPPYQWPHEEDKIDSKILPNGNIENKYKHYLSENCIYIFEIDPKTRKIVGAHFEGSEKDCIIIP